MEPRLPPVDEWRCEDTRRYAVIGRVAGWVTRLEVDARSGARTVTLEHPRDTAFEAALVVHADGTRETWQSRNANRVPVAVSVFAGLAASNPTGEVAGTDGLLMPLRRPDDGCVCCGTVSPPLAGLDLPLSGLCHTCAKWHSRFAVDVPDADCEHLVDYLFDDDDQPCAWRDAHRWRDDPRTHSDIGQIDELWEWLRGRGLPTLQCHPGERYGHMLRFPPERERLLRGVYLSHSHGGIVGHAVGMATIALPARHELLDILTALQPYPRDEAVAMSAMARCAVSDDRGVRYAMSMLPQYEHLPTEVLVEAALLGDSTADRQVRIHVG